VLGGIIAGSHKEWGRKVGDKVKKGGELGRIVGSYGMLHFETYAATPDRTKNSRWYRDDPPPEGLRNPANYLERMVGDTGVAAADAPAPPGPQRPRPLQRRRRRRVGLGRREALKKAQAALGVAVGRQVGPEHRGRDPERPAGLGGRGRGPRATSATCSSPLRTVGGIVAGIADRQPHRCDRGDDSVAAAPHRRRRRERHRNPRWRQRLTLVAFGTSTMLTGLAIGYALGLRSTRCSERSPERTPMEFSLAYTRRMQLSALVMPRGEYAVEVLQPGDTLALFLVRGCLQITRRRTGEPASYSLHATPSSPLIILNPGTYTIVAERSALGLRGSRRAR
jgi:hypothetical protein